VKTVSGKVVRPN